MKIVINACYGGFSISEACARHMAAAGSERAQKDLAEYEATKAACAHYRATGKLPDGCKYSTDMFDIDIKHRNGVPQYHGYGYIADMEGGYERDDPLLIAAVEALGPEVAGGFLSNLRIVEIPDGVEWEISEYDGVEHVAEKHRTWA